MILFFASIQKIKKILNICSKFYKYYITVTNFFNRLRKSTQTLIRMGFQRLYYRRFQIQIAK